ncbi:hypothetical protein EON65_45515 [archaeon]|nr:MAG: hypothetical protein EON65_45515 [archaeon]
MDMDIVLSILDHLVSFLLLLESLLYMVNLGCSPDMSSFLFDYIPPSKAARKSDGSEGAEQGKVEEGIGAVEPVTSENMTNRPIPQAVAIEKTAVKAKLKRPGIFQVGGKLTHPISRSHYLWFLILYLCLMDARARVEVQEQDYVAGACCLLSNGRGGHSESDESVRARRKLLFFPRHTGCLILSNSPKRTCIFLLYTHEYGCYILLFVTTTFMSASTLRRVCRPRNTSATEFRTTSTRRLLVE